MIDTIVYYLPHAACLFVGSIAGFGICAVMTVGKAGDEQTALAEHARLADACLAKQARIDRALSVETPKAAHGVKKMAAILRGDL